MIRAAALAAGLLLGAGCATSARLVEVPRPPAVERRVRATAAHNEGVERYRAEVFDGAAESFERAIAIDPTLAESHRALAFIYDVHRPDPERARAHYDAYLRLRPNDVAVRPLASSLR